MEYATRNANKARDNAFKMDQKNQDRILKIKHEIKKENDLLSEIDCEIKVRETEASNYDILLKNIERDQDASKLLAAVNNRIENLRRLRAETVSRMCENYTNSLLSDSWILMGFKDIADEYSTKFNELRARREMLERQYHVNLVSEKVQNAIENGVDFVKISDLSIKPYYQNNYIGELQKRDTTLNDNLSDITTMRHKIQELIAFNNRLHDDVQKIDANLENEFEQKKRILAHTDGLTEEQLLANYESISTWMDKKNRADNRVDILKRQREQHREILEKAQLDLSKISEGTAAAMYAKTALILQHISDSFKNAKDLIKKNMLLEIEDWANMLLPRLCPDTYTGTIKVSEKANGQGELFLVDSNCCSLFNPGYSLRKACMLAVMLVIIKLCEEREKSNYPLIAEGSFAQYEESNGNRFFDASNGQMIIITGDYLRTSPDGRKVLDYERLKTMCATLYRIEKRRPFDAKKLGTLQTIVTRIL